MSYVRKELIRQTIKLFQEQPEMRDERFGTIEYIIKTYYQDVYGKNIIGTANLFFNIDRAFREIQQVNPKLRGKDWLKRQRHGGELTKAQFEAIQDISNQLEIGFE